MSKQDILEGHKDLPYYDSSWTTEKIQTYLTAQRDMIKAGYHLDPEHIGYELTEADHDKDIRACVFGEIFCSVKEETWADIERVMFKGEDSERLYPIQADRNADKREAVLHEICCACVHKPLKITKGMYNDSPDTHVGTGCWKGYEENSGKYCQIAIKCANAICSAKIKWV